MYLMCGPRQLFFQCGPEMTKVWIPINIQGPLWSLQALVPLEQSLHGVAPDLSCLG